PAPLPYSEKPACANRRAFSYLSFDDCYSFGVVWGIAGFIAPSCRVQTSAPLPYSEKPVCANRRAFSYLSFDDCYSFGVVWGGISEGLLGL
ncbi:hypothetical protein ACFFLG_16010, partial [Shewanella indica]|uniref:hypothetical protein n=1 Tax=Shewanella indica TaxID=768528 RepID=UPI0035ED7086